MSIECLLEEDRVLKARLARRDPRFTDDDRRRLAVKGKVLGPKLLADVAGRHLGYRPALAPKTHCSEAELQLLLSRSRIVEGLPADATVHVRRKPERQAPRPSWLAFDKSPHG